MRICNWIEFNWVPQPSGQIWLRIRTTTENLTLLVIAFSRRERHKRLDNEKRDLKYLLDKLQEAEVLEPVFDGVSNLPRVAGIHFDLKLQSKQRSTNRKHLTTLIGQYGSVTQVQSTLQIDAQVQQVRQQVYENIQQEYGKIRMFGIPEPVDVNDIYTATDVWREIINQRWRSLFELLQSCPSTEALERLGLERHEPVRHSGWHVAENFQRLMVLGKPGIGKTTYLKYLAIQCAAGRFQPDKVPIFVQLAHFGKVAQQDVGQDQLFSFVSSVLVGWGVPKEIAQEIIKQGRALILLDGLDEVISLDDALVSEEISRFINYYPSNAFLITCRVAANKYRFSREKFVEIEVADFSREQAESFIRLWFKALQGNCAELEVDLSEDLIEALNQPPHRAIRELAVTPLLLNLTCIVFRDLKSLPKTQHQLYEQGINALLEDWDRYRNVQRDEICLNLGKANKIELLLELARTTFEQSRYIFKEQLARDIVSQYLQRYGVGSSNPTQVYVNSQTMLELIAAHHGLLVKRATGILSFSHLTYHEYFTARSIYLEQAWKVLLPQICNPQWREVFLLVIEMQSPCNDLICLMYQQIQSIFAIHTDLQCLLVYVDHRARQTASTLPYKPAALRAWYLSLIGCNFDDGVASFRKSGQASVDYQALPLARTMGIDQSLVEDLLEFNFLYRRLCDGLSLVSEEPLANDLISALVQFYEEHLVDQLLPAILSIKQLLLQLDNLTSSLQQNLFIDWWRQEGEVWASHLVQELQASDPEAIRELHQLMHPRQTVRKEVLQQYYNANLLLLDGMRRSEFVTSELQEEIESTLFKPSRVDNAQI